MKFTLLLIFGLISGIALSQCPAPNGVTSYRVSCPGSVSVTAISTASNANVVHRWYTSSSGSMYFLYSSGIYNGYTTSTTYTSNILENTTFYVEAYNPVSNCVSERVAIRVLVGPWITASGTVASVCTTLPSLILTASDGGSYQWNNFTTPIPGATSQSYTPTTVGLYTVTVGGLACGQKTSDFYILPSGKPHVATTGAISDCGPSTLQITAMSQTLGGAVTEHKWYTSPSGTETVPCEVIPVGSGAAYQTRISKNFSQTQTFYVAAINSNCGEGPRFPVTATINAPPVISGPTITYTGDPALVFPADNFTLTASASGFASYQWYKNSVAIAGATGISYKPTVTGQYSVSGTYLCGTVMSNLVAVNYYNETQTNISYIHNYVAQRAMLTDVGVMTSVSDPKIVQRNTIYYDGLGRALQEVKHRMSPSGVDEVLPHAYDIHGRESHKYLPYSNGASGFYKPDAIAGYSNSKQFMFYQSNVDNRAEDVRPFTEISFDNSPLNRPLKEFNAGQAWYSADRAVRYQYTVNEHGIAPTGEKIIAWNIGSDGLPVRSNVSENYVENGGYYSSGQLQIKITSDEAGNFVREYVDKAGRTILKKIQAVSTTSDLNSLQHWALTYYLYDDAGNLRFVFQPELSKIVHQNDAYIPSAVDLGAFAFQYTYDGRKRMSGKKNPGADWVYMVYDNRDRLVLTQDGNQRSATTQYWMFTKYDAMNRAVLVGIKDTAISLSQAAMQGVVTDFYNKAWVKLYEEYTGTTTSVHGYSNKSYPLVTTGATLDVNRYLTANYYDNYSFISVFGSNYDYHDDGLVGDVNDVSYTQATLVSQAMIGKLTGMKTKVLDGGVAGGYTWLKSVNYYDNKYRVIQVLTDNYKGGIDRVSRLYDFVGKVIKTKTTHQQTDVAQWKDLVGVSIIGNKITRTVTGSNWGVSGLASIEFMPANTEGWVEFTASEENTLRMLGLSASNADANYPSIGYAFYLRNDKTLWVYEGTSKGQIADGYKAGDILRIQRVGNRIKYFRNGIDVSPIDPTQIASSTPLYVDIALGTSLATIINVKSSFSGGIHTLTKRFSYDHAGRLLTEGHSFDGQNEVELVKNEYNELGQLVDKKLHSVAGAPFKQSVDYRYNIRGWLTNLNDSKLADGENDYFGMNIAYNEELGIGNASFAFASEGQINSYAFDGNATDVGSGHLDGIVYGAVLTQDSQGNANNAYSFGSANYIEIPGSKSKHAFIQNTGEFTITSFLKLSDLSARSVILSSTSVAANKGFLFMYETSGGSLGDHQLRFTITNGESGLSSVALGTKNAINDTNWHHVAVVGDGSYVRFYVDGVQDGPPTPITLYSNGESSYTTLIGRSRTTNGALFLGMSGSIDELNVFDRALSQREVQAFSRRAVAGVTISSGQYNGNISGIKWSVNQGMSDVKEMAYNFDYDPMNRLTSATNFQSGESQIWQAGNYGEGGLLYDLNGNIKNLVRYGSVAGIMDNLSYNYGSTTPGNQLLKVTDAGDKFAGFTDGVNTTNDYTYDANGNMVTDQNKGISGGITYNYLNLPELIVRSTGSVRNIYDVVGRKLAQVVVYGSLSTQTDYVGEFLYENDALQSINHEEGRIVVLAEELVYSFDGSTIDPITALNVALSPITANGDQTYLLIQATSTVTGTGAFPIGGVFPVKSGERYRVRARGYRDKGSAATASPAYIRIQANGTDLVWPGAALQSTSSTEAWVEQIVTIPAGATELYAGVTWNTVLQGNTIYLNDFEITRISETEPEYQYFMKDHLGNVRLTFTTKDDIDESVATLEDESEADEQGKFIYYDEAVKLYSSFFDHTNNGSAGYAALLRGGANERYGLAKSISVMPGDTIKMEVYAKYLDPNTDSWTTQLADLMASIATGGNAPAGILIDGGVAGSIGGAVFPFAGLLSHTEEQSAGVKAYLNWIIFDKNYQYIDGGYTALSETAAESGQNTEHQQLAHSFTVKEPGFVYIYLSNESETPIDVFFDDFNVEQVKSNVIQVEDYYPFGMAFNTYQRENSLAQRYQFGGKEKQETLDLGWIDFGARMYLPEIGRWGMVDPHAETYEITTPYNYAFNNPSLFVDPNGKDNIIYLLVIDGFSNEQANSLAYAATAILDLLGLNTQVRVYDQKRNGKFNPKRLDATDNWAVIGHDRKAVSKLAQELSQNEKYDQLLQEYGVIPAGSKYPELSNTGTGEKPNSARGIAVHYNDPLFKTDKDFSAVISIIHGAGHSSDQIKADHFGAGIMQDAYNLWNDYYNHPDKRDVITRENTNGRYIDAMVDRYGTNEAKDNAFNGSVKQASSNGSQR